MPGSSADIRTKHIGYELFILLLSMLSIFNLVYILLSWTDPVVQQVVELMDGFVLWCSRSIFFIACSPPSPSAATSSGPGDGLIFFRASPSLN